MNALRRPGLARLGVLLALAAMLGIFALSAWHSTTVNDADPVHAVSIAHVDDGSPGSDPDGVIHVAAHATGHFLSVAAAPAALPTLTVVERPWTPLATVDLDGSDPAGLLRPPRG